MRKKLLLISNTISHEGGLLDHCIDKIKEFAGKEQLLYVPFALKDWDKFEKLIQERFERENIRISSIHHEKDFQKAVLKAKVLFIGGGNTFRLLGLLQKHSLIQIIKKRVEAGELVYIGSSAGTNVACPTIMTTNDMPIVELNNLKALSLIPFQVNPHYIDQQKNKTDKMETRDDRLKQYLEENDGPVLALREGSFLTYIDGNLTLQGKTGGKLFIKDEYPKELRKGEILNYLL